MEIIIQMIIYQTKENNHQLWTVLSFLIKIIMGYFLILGDIYILLDIIFIFMTLDIIIIFGDVEGYLPIEEIEILSVIKNNFFFIIDIFYSIHFTL